MTYDSCEKRNIAGTNRKCNAAISTMQSLVCLGKHLAESMMGLRTT